MPEFEFTCGDIVVAPGLAIWPSYMIVTQIRETWFGHVILRYRAKPIDASGTMQTAYVMLEERGLKNAALPTRPWLLERA